MDYITTITLNPSLDASATAAHIRPETKIRVSERTIAAGGGGINVARAASRLATEPGRVCALWVGGGAPADQLAAALDGEGVAHERLPIAAPTRENLSITTDDGEQYRFTFPGAPLDEIEFERLLLRVEAVPPGWVVLSGSTAPGPREEDGWARVIQRLPAGCRVALDSHGLPLARALALGVAFVKPNLEELSMLLPEGAPTGTPALARAARHFVETRPVEILLVSMGSAGALLATLGGVWRLHNPPVTPKSRIGAGDSAVAGAVCALARGDSPVEAARWAVAAGAAAALTPDTDLCHASDVERLLPRVGVQVWDER